MNGLLFEVIAKRKIAQHLKKGVMTRGITHIFQVVVFAACAYTFLCGGGARVGAFIKA